MNRCLTLFLLISTLAVQAEDLTGSTDTTFHAPEYSFILQDMPSRLFTIRQINQNFFSGYRLFAREMNRWTDKELISGPVQLGLMAFFFLPFTHEEGHCAILTSHNIGSVCKPFFLSRGGSAVTGVSNATLQNLRDTDLPEFIRLHTAGLESDYMMTKRMEECGSFDQDAFRNFKWEYWYTKFAILQYYMLGLFHYDLNESEEKNELDRDIVGLDTYGAIRHLFRPTMPFYRYTRYEDLTGEERKFLRRTEYRSFLNLANPLIVGIKHFPVSGSFVANFGLGYTMAPFGDFIDETIWIKGNKGTNLTFYARQFQNKNYWFPGLGVALVGYCPVKKLSMDIRTHFWQQPRDYDFNTNHSFTGGAFETDFRWYLFTKNKTAIGIDTGFIYKTKGFLPEEVVMDHHFGIRFGASIRL